MPTAPGKPPTTMRHRLARSLDIDTGLPEPVRRAKRGYMVTIAVIALALCTIFVLEILDLVPDLGNAPMYAYFVLFMSACIFWHRSSKRALRRAAAHDHLLCPDCTYDLRTLDHAGTCPECGRAYEHAAVRARWLDAERRLKRRKDRRPSDEHTA